MDEEKPDYPDPEFIQRMMKGNITLDDFYQLLKKMIEIGKFDKHLTMIGGGNLPEGLKRDAENILNQWSTMIQSMTEEERKNPKLLKKSRKRRIAVGAGVEYSAINSMLKQFNQLKMFSKVSKLTGASKLKKKISLLMKEYGTDMITIERKYLSEVVDSKSIMIDPASGLPLLKNSVKSYLESKNIRIRYTDELIEFYRKTKE